MTRTTFSQSPDGLLSGEIAPSSGIYRTLHNGCPQSEIWIKKGARFPLCSGCGESSAFVLEEEVEHISEDDDFS